VDYGQILAEIQNEIKPFASKGKVADYIPELGLVNPDKFGVHLTCLDGHHFSIGDSHEKFSIQSISKVLSVALAFSIIREKIWERVGVEPSGSTFNSLALLEYEKGIPRNPLINSGALVVADILFSHLKEPKKDFLKFVRRLAGTDDINFNLKVAASEKGWGHRNTAMAYMLKSFGNIHNNVEEVLDFYFHTCSIEMTCKELAQAFIPFANHGKDFNSNEKFLTSSQIKRLNALMQTCGFYDEAGEFSFKVGLPGKSGVGGGIAAVYPTKYSIAVWSPRLNKKGNSVLGMKALELLTTKTGMSIF
jgi:glutaminase